ncbi:MAG: hypothetical protein KJ847_02225 [Firmicutes bacterium]|nr:hypothetical protein [Bacillota bacterium]
MIIIAGQTYQPRAPGGIYLKQLNLDVITVLEKTGRIENALDGNDSSIQEILEATPTLACMEISVLNDADEVIINAIKSDCNETTDLDIQTSARPVIYQDDMYIIKSWSWFRKEP